MKHQAIRELVRGALIAALYVALTLLASALGLSSGVIQLRFSEALCILPCFTAAAIPGLTVGCLLANALTGCALWDVIFGSIATFIGALGAWHLRRHKWLAPLPSILSNTLIVPLVLMYVYQAPGSYGYFVLTVGIGELLSCGVLGMALHTLVQKRLTFLFDGV